MKTKISELLETLNIDNDSVFPLVFRNETRKVRFETIRELLTDLSSDYTEKSGNIVTIITNIDSYCNIGIRSTNLKNGTPVTLTISGKNLINEEELTLNDDNTIVKSNIFRLIPGQNYTFNTHSYNLENNMIQWALEYFDENNESISENLDGWYDLTDFTTVPENAKYGQISIRYFYDYQFNIFSLEDLYNTQFELGTLASDYESYSESKNIGSSVGGSIIDVKILEGTSVIYSDDIENIILKVGYYTDTEIGNKITQLIDAIGELRNEKADRTEIPDVSQFITNTVNDLVNYYKKTETYTKTEINDLINKVNSLKMIVVEELPTEDINLSTIYLVPIVTNDDKDAYKEYVYISDRWELIGTTDVDLSNHVTKAELTKILNDSEEVFVSNEMPTNNGWKIWIDENETDNENIQELVAYILDYYRKQEIDEKITVLNNENIKLRNQIPNGTASGESINLKDSSDLTIENLTIFGNTYQETREGYNLFDKNTNIATSKYFGTSGEILAASAEDNYLQEEYIEVKANTNYFLSTATYIRVCEYDSEKNFIKISNSTTSNSLTITTSDTTKYIRVSFVGSLDTFQITEGTDDKGYEQYGATPSIDFPSPILSVSGENEVVVNNKNWLKIPDDSVPTNQSLNGLTVTIKNGEITINGTATADWANLTSNIPINIKAGTYTFSRNNSSYDLVLRCYKADGTYKEVWLVNSFKTTTTFPEDIVEYYVYVGGFSVGTVFTDFKLKLQLEEGSTATDHIEHQSQNYPISLGENEIFEDGYLNIEYEQNAGYKRVTRASIVNSYFKRNYPITRSMCGSREVQGFYFKISNIDSASKIKSSHQKEIKTNNYYTDEDWQKYDGNTIGYLYPTANKGAIYINVPKDITEIDDFVTWWNELNPQLYYKLATPTETELTDAALLAQLEALINAETYKNITHVDTNGESLNANIKLTYRKDLETMFENINNSILSLGGIL